MEDGLKQRVPLPVTAISPSRSPETGAAQDLGIVVFDNFRNSPEMEATLQDAMDAIEDKDIAVSTKLPPDLTCE